MFNSLGFQLVLLPIQSVVLYLISRRSIYELSSVFRHVVKSRTVHFWFLTIFFLPGTILHEMSHFLVASALGLRVRDLQIFPRFEEGNIRLGQVLYEKRDVFRGIVVGVAPFFGGLGFFLVLYYFKLFPSSVWGYNLLFGYLVYTVSTMMFSSKQDLKDAVFIIPFILLIAVVFYILNIRIDVAIGNAKFVRGAVNLLKHLNLYLFIAFALNIGLIALIKGVQSLVRR